MAAMKLKKGDVVQVISGKDRGKQGRVLEAHPRERRVIVENVNVVKRHRRPRPMKNPTAGTVISIVPSATPSTVRGIWPSWLAG